MKFFLALITVSLISVSAPQSQAQPTDTVIEQMPAQLETQFALSALPPPMRNQASVYVLDPKKGYQLSRQ